MFILCYVFEKITIDENLPSGICRLAVGSSKLFEGAHRDVIDYLKDTVSTDLIMLKTFYSRGVERRRRRLYYFPPHLTP